VDDIRLELAPWQATALHNPYTHFAMIGGVAIGKSFTGAHFAIYHIVNMPELTGFVGANTHDQLSQVSLRELMYWLDQLQLPYVIGKMPPASWGPRRFKSYENILSVRVGQHCVSVFTRVLSEPNNLRGLEFSWYWIDETRDTPQDTHDVILSRLREGPYIKGLVTTTPSGEDWTWERFVARKIASSADALGAEDTVYGSSHTPTSESVRFGIITAAFYRTLRRSYSPQMAAQELDAAHVITRTGRAYYTFDERNQRRGFQPDPRWPLVIGMDFNFQPSPMVWLVGQHDPEKESIHWFDELSGVEVSSRQMARRLANAYGEWFLRIYGDASGTRGTTSNAGETDYAQIADELTEAGVQFTIDTDQANPLVRDRVENVCRLGRNGMDEVAMTVDPDRCPLLWQDLCKVIWKNGKLSADKGDAAVAHLLTHGGDGAGYACWKVLPPSIGPTQMGHRVQSVNNPMSEAHR
jgi:hypothetical protein